jgi:anti-sigma B factor antagonist
MTGPPPTIEIHETPERDELRLSVTGELDLASTPALRQRLDSLRADRKAVRLDLSGLEFIDSTGVQLLFDAFRSVSADGWSFRIDPHVSPQVMRVLELVKLDQLILSEPPITFEKRA